MTRALHLLAVCLLVVAGGCLGGPLGPSTTPSATPTISAQAAGELAIDAEKERIERRAARYETLVGLGFGILEPAEFEVVTRDGTGVHVRVNVGYSVSLDCDVDGEPESSLDGANVEATYLVTGERVRLQEVSRDFFDPGRYC